MSAGGAPFSPPARPPLISLAAARRRGPAEGLHP